MDISRKVVLFRLSPQGRQALRGLVPKKGSFPALVLGTDSIGAWILLGGKATRENEGKVPMMMLKWDYIATVAFEAEPEVSLVREPIGFQPKS